MNITTKSIWERELSLKPLLIGLHNGAPYMGAVCFIVECGQPIRCFRISQPATMSRIWEAGEAHGQYEYGMVTSYDDDVNPVDLFQPDEEVTPWRVYKVPYKYQPYTKGENAYHKSLIAEMEAAGVTDPDQLPRRQPDDRDRRLKRAGNKSKDRRQAEGSLSAAGGEQADLR